MQNIFRHLDRAVATIPSLLFSILISGCADSSLPKTTSFDPAAAAQANQAIVIVGLAVSREPTVHNFILGGEHSVLGAYDLSWEGLDAAGRLTSDERHLMICSIERMNFGDFVSPCEPTKMDYRIISVPAGTYVMRSFSVKWKNGNSTINTVTSFVGTSTGSMGQTYVPGPGHALSRQGYKFSVKPGQIAYIGNLTFDPQLTPAPLTMGRDDRAAKEALKSYPGVSGEFVFAPVSRD